MSNLRLSGIRYGNASARTAGATRLAEMDSLLGLVAVAFVGLHLTWHRAQNK